MPAREINPFTALTRIRSQFLRTQWSTSNHQRVDMTMPQTVQPSGLASLYWEQPSKTFWELTLPGYAISNDRRPHPSWVRSSLLLRATWATYILIPLQCLNKGTVHHFGGEIPWRWSLHARVFYVVNGFFYFHPQCQYRRLLRFYVICEPRSIEGHTPKCAEKLISFYFRLSAAIQNDGPSGFPAIL